MCERANESQTKSLIADSFVEGEGNALRYLALFVLLYTIFWTLIYAFILNDEFEESLTFVDALYFIAVTFTTVGYGDLSLVSSPVKLVTMFVAFVAVIFVGLVLGMFGEKMVTNQNEAKKDAKRKLRKKFIQRYDNSGEEYEADFEESENENTKENEDEKRNQTLAEKIVWVLAYRIPNLVVVGAVALVIGHFEKWNFMDSVYYAVITATTIGYGDKSPSTQGMRILAVFYLPLAVGVVGEFTGAIASAFVDHAAEKADDKFLHTFENKLCIEDIHEIDQGDDKKVNELEFIVFMLKAMKKVDKADIDDLKAVFKRLDVDGSGELDADDMLRIGNGRQGTHR